MLRTGLGALCRLGIARTTSPAVSVSKSLNTANMMKHLPDYVSSACQVLWYLTATELSDPKISSRKLDWGLRM